MIELTVRHESWPLARRFAISRGSRTTAEVLVVELAGDGARGRGECIPYSRYRETVAGVRQTLEGLAPRLTLPLETRCVSSTWPGGVPPGIRTMNGTRAASS